MQLHCALKGLTRKKKFLAYDQKHISNRVLDLQHPQQISAYVTVYISKLFENHGGKIVCIDVEKEES